MDEKVREIEKRLQNRYSEVPDRFLWPLMDVQYLLSHISTLEGRLEIQERVLTENENLLSGLQSANKTVLLLEDKVKELGNMVALAAREINCSGPLVERIRVLKQEFQRNLEVATERAEKAEARNKELRGGIEKLEEKSQNITDESDSWGCVHYESLMELYKLIEGD